MKSHYMYRKRPGENELMFSLCGCIMDFETDRLKPSMNIEEVTCKRCIKSYHSGLKKMHQELRRWARRNED